MKLVIATRNRHKLEEIHAIFNFAGLEVCSAFDFPEIPDVVEDGATLEANAIKKASEICRATGLPALADDSGLEVEALNGAPGIYSARWSGEGCTYHDNNVKLLRELSGKENRRARFRTVIALALPGETPQTVEGSVQGWIIDKMRGDQGFGYDPLFVPDGYNQTFAELPADVKNRISHRARALNAASNIWKHFFQGLEA
ncbi:MAG TPA: XTP/dITP diphosphatase [Pontiellaceae bacterium]|nr:XTP/dITP diphosphatase [Pontiellaceae bacterium]